MNSSDVLPVTSNLSLTPKPTRRLLSFGEYKRTCWSSAEAERRKMEPECVEETRKSWLTIFPICCCFEMTGEMTLFSVSPLSLHFHYYISDRDSSTTDYLENPKKYVRLPTRRSLSTNFWIFHTDWIFIYDGIDPRNQDGLRRSQEGQGPKQLDLLVEGVYCTSICSLLTLSSTYWLLSLVIVIQA